MPIEPVFEKLNVKEKVGEVVCQIKADCKTDVPSGEVERVLGDGAFCSVAVLSVSDGKAEIAGKTTFFISYVADGEIKKCECGAEIKDAFVSDSIAEGDFISISWSCDKSEIDLSGIKLSATAYVTVKGEIFRKKDYECLTGGEGLFCDAKSINVIKNYGTAVSTYVTEEEFEVRYAVKEVLSHRAEACLSAVQCGVGTIICDGEIYLTEILLQSGDKNDIIRENRIIPFRAEIECDDAMPQTLANCRVFVKSLKTDVSVDETKNVSVLSVNVSLGLNGEAFSLSEQTVAADAFNTENEITLTKTRARFAQESALSCTVVKISGRAAIGDADFKRIVCAMGEKVEIASVKKAEGGINVSGALSANLLFSDEENKVFSRKAEIPFDTFIQCDAEGEVQAVAVPKSASAKLITLTEAECDAEAVFTVLVKKSFEADVISAVETGEAKLTENAAISVYIPQAGDGLWELSKRLNLCPENLVATNPELQFPLTGKERILVYRQK